MSEPFLYEFLYRGRPAGDAQPAAYHVIIGQYVTPPGAAEPQFVSSGALTPTQAEAAGFPLSVIIEGINAAALVAKDEALSQRDAAIAERDSLAAQLAALRPPPDVPGSLTSGRPAPS